jgi:hypothetical protein
VNNGQQQPGGSNSGRASGDPRQYSREYGMRRQEAERLRDELAGKGIDTRELDKAINDLRQLEQSRALYGDPKGLAELQSQVIEGLKTFEFGLYRKLGLMDDGRAASGARPPVPAEYRALVEEYYKSLAAEKKRR